MKGYASVKSSKHSGIFWLQLMLEPVI